MNESSYWNTRVIKYISKWIKIKSLTLNKKEKQKILLKKKG